MPPLSRAPGRPNGSRNTAEESSASSLGLPRCGYVPARAIGSAGDRSDRRRRWPCDATRCGSTSGVRCGCCRLLRWWSPLAVGAVLSLVRLPPGAPLAFQGTADDARTLLIGITSTMVTVIALLLGLTVVALQLSSTQFSPRLLRNFLRDRPNQLVLSSFVAHLRVHRGRALHGRRLGRAAAPSDFPRLAVTGAILLLFVSLAMLVYFADHLAHSIQVDAIVRVVAHQTLAVVDDACSAAARSPCRRRHWPCPSPRGGPATCRPLPSSICCGGPAEPGLLRLHLGSASTWWPGRAGLAVAGVPQTSAPDRPRSPRPLDRAVRIGFERTLEQDAAFGIRQLVDMACKALSPAVNDPYTAVQAVDHLSVIFCGWRVRPLATTSPRTGGRSHGRRPRPPIRRLPGDMCGLIRRYGAGEPTVAQAMLRLLVDCSAAVGDDPDRQSGHRDGGPPGRGRGRSARHRTGRPDHRVRRSRAAARRTDRRRLQRLSRRADQPAARPLRVRPGRRPGDRRLPGAEPRVSRLRAERG